MLSTKDLINENKVKLVPFKILFILTNSTTVKTKVDTYTSPLLYTKTNEYINFMLIQFNL